MEFQRFPSIPRWSRDIIITEKIDGTNGQIAIRPRVLSSDEGTHIDAGAGAAWKDDQWVVRAGSRGRYLGPGQSDNFGFFAWVRDNGAKLVTLLGPGRHFGEWWGPGIQRGYGIARRRFSLFNTTLWKDLVIPDGMDMAVVPELYRGPQYANTELGAVDMVLSSMGRLDMEGSLASPGFMRPEGIVIYHTAAGQAFKKTFDNDQGGKQS